MPFYPPEVNRRFLAPNCAGKARGANAVGTSASFECGCFVRSSLRIEPEHKLIAEARFLTNGCGYMTAAADAAAEMLEGRALPDLNAAEGELLIGIEIKVGGLPDERRQCALVAAEAVRLAFADFRAYLLEEFSGDKALICTCFGVDEETIEKFIATNSPGSIEEVTAACRAGGGCGSCRMLIQEMLDEHEMQAGLQ